MRVEQCGLAALFAVAGVAVAIGAAPIAVADECDPIATVCQGPEVGVTEASPSFAPAPDLFADNGGAPSEMQLTDENQDQGPGFADSHGGGGGHGR